MRAIWDPKKSPAANLANMGLQSSVNSAIDARGAIALAAAHEKDPNLRNAKTENKVIELFDIPESDKVNGITTLPGKTFAQRKLPVSVDDQKYIGKCLAKHGENYRSMMRDIKTNDMQYTDSQLRKMATRFFLLGKDQIRVDIPEKVRHLMACCKGDGDRDS